jgi:hypothetical protein
MMRCFACVGLSLLLIGAAPSAQRPTLKEMVNQAQPDVRALLVCSSPAPLTFPQLLATTDHIVRAVVGRGVVRLSDDGHHILTTFEIRNQNVVFSGRASPDQ